MTFSVDNNGLRGLSADLRGASASLAPKVAAVVVKGAVNIKTAMRADAEASTHFKGIARSIAFTTHKSRDAFEAEIGPAHGTGEPGNLANIAYFGTPRGGGTVRNPQAALDDEAPKFEAALAALLGDVL